MKERQIKNRQGAGEWKVKTEENEQWKRAEGEQKGETGRAETESVESVACVLVPSPVRPLSAGDLWHRDWEQSPLPALYCYY